MPPRYPFARNHPSQASSSSSDPSAPQSRYDDRPIVLSASGRNPSSPAEGLAALSPVEYTITYPLTSQRTLRILIKQSQLPFPHIRGEEPSNQSGREEKDKEPERQGMVEDRYRVPHQRHLPGELEQ